MWKKHKKLLILTAALMLLNLMLVIRIVVSPAAGKTAQSSITAEAQCAAAILADAGTDQDVQPKEQTGKVALTFDDGPSAVYTPQLLDGLAKRGVKATFFITGENAAENPEIVKRIYEEGHLIGNHTYSHLQLSQSNREAFKEELVKTNTVIQKITGEEVIYVRPPYGSWDKSLEKELNLFPVLWTIDPLDWCTKNAASVVRKVVPKVKENSVILLHDEYASTVTAALQIVDDLQEKGYEFVTVEEILFD